MKSKTVKTIPVNSRIIYGGMEYKCIEAVSPKQTCMACDVNKECNYELNHGNNMKLKNKIFGACGQHQRTDKCNVIWKRVKHTKQGLIK